MGIFKRDDVKEKHPLIGRGDVDEFKNENVLLCESSELWDGDNNACHSDSDHSDDSLRYLDDSSGYAIAAHHVDLCIQKFGDCPVRPIIHRRMREFRRTCKRFSDDQKGAIWRVGFGFVYGLKCDELNVPLCHYFCNNFDTENLVIKFHGRYMAVNPKDFEHVMMLTDGGTDVDLCGNIEDTEIVMLKSKLWGEEENITLDVLAEIVVSSQIDDDAFLINFCLYALSTLIIPNESDRVDLRLLVPLKDSEKISMYNWASFAFKHLIDGIARYQSSGSAVYGCIAFLQLFYLDIVPDKVRYVGSTTSPVYHWSNTLARTVFDRGEKEGGFNSGIIVPSKKRHGRYGLNIAGSEDNSTGLRTTLVEDVAKVTKLVEELKVRMKHVRSRLCEMHPGMVVLRKALVTLEQLVSQLSEEGIDNMVLEVVDEVLAEEGEYEEPVMDECRGYEEGTHSVSNFSLDEAFNDPIDTGSTERDPGGLKRKLDLRDMDDYIFPEFPVVGEFSSKDSSLISFLFGQLTTRYDEVGRHVIAKSDDCSTTVWDLSCLSPNENVRKEVVDLAVSYLFERGGDRWFMPSVFAERAKEFANGNVEEGLVLSTITSCRLRRYSTGLSSCRQVFFPIHDAGSEQWILVVLDLVTGVCEIWDSSPNINATARREGFVTAVVGLFVKVFEAELRLCPTINLSSLSIRYPMAMPESLERQDSGIFVIRNMQHYRHKWFETFNSGDQRVRLALDLVKHPMNEIRAIVLAAAGQQVFPSLTDEPVQNPNYADGPELPVMKFKSRATRRWA